MVTAILAAAGLLGPAHAQDHGAFAEGELRDPLEIRDEHVLAQGRLTLPAAGPDPVASGTTRVRLSFLWGNSFSWTQDVAGEAPGDRRFLIDGETRTLDLSVTRGLAEHLDLTLRVPLRWRGGGTLDGFIDAWHDAFRFTGIPDGDRPRFLKNAFRVTGVTEDGESFDWSDGAGTGLGNLELASRWRVHAQRTSVALVARLSLPTATSPYERAWGGGLQLVVRRPLHRVFDLHLGAGGTVESTQEVRGVAYEPARVHAYLALVYRPWPRLSLTVETNAASRLVADIDRYPGLHWIVNGGLKFAAARRVVLELGMTENLKDQLSTTDFAAYFAISLRP